RAIIGGSPSLDDPSVVLLVGDEGICSGTVVGRRTVLTAGHCTVATPSTLSVLFTNDGRDPNAIRRGVVEVAADPTMDPNTFFPDVGMLVLDDDAPVPAIPISHSAAKSFLGRTARLVGFGRDQVPIFGLKRQTRDIVDFVDDDHFILFA